MSEKTSKGYDPTVARMVGNMLAGYPKSWMDKDNTKYYRDRAIAAALDVVKDLRKLEKEDRR